MHFIRSDLNTKCSAVLYSITFHYMLWLLQFPNTGSFDESSSVLRHQRVKILSMNMDIVC